MSGHYGSDTSVFNTHLHLHLSLNRRGLQGTSDDFTTSFLHFSLFSTALWDMANSRPVHSLMLSSHLFLCLPSFCPLSLCLARWFCPDLMNGKHDYTTAVCVFLRSSGDLHEVQLPAGSSQRKSRSYCWASVDVPERRKREGRGERLKRPKTWSSFECL